MQFTNWPHHHDQKYFLNLAVLFYDEAMAMDKTGLFNVNASQLRNSQLKIELHTKGIQAPQ